MLLMNNDQSPTLLTQLNKDLFSCGISTAKLYSCGVSISVPFLQLLSKIIVYLLESFNKEKLFQLWLHKE